MAHRLRSAGSLAAAVLVAVLTVALAAGCAAQAAPLDPPRSVDPTASVTPADAASASTVASDPATAATSRLDPSALPRALSYGMLRWTLTGTAITNESPNTYVAGVEGVPTATTSLIADFEIRNDDVHVTFVTSTARLVAVLADGSVVPGKDVARRSVPPTSSVDGRYAFTVPVGTAFDGLVLRFEDPGREPSVDLPLTGPAPEVEANVVLDAQYAAELAIPGVDMTWTVEQLLVGRDWPLPIGFKGGTLVPGARATKDHRWIGVVARVDVGRCDCRGGVLDQAGSARLLVDGLPYTVAAAESSQAILNASTFSNVQLVFEVPWPPSEAVLQVGALDEPAMQATFALDLE
jgi:hypothetical protein